MFSITNHQGNTNQNYNEILLDPYQNGHDQKHVGEDMEKNTPSVVMYSSRDTTENSLEIPQKTKVKYVHDPAIPLLEIHPKEMK